MFYIRLSFCWILVMLTLWSSGQQYNIRGEVVDALTHKPIAGAIVFINNTTKGGFTDSTGNFIIGQVEEKNFYLVAIPKGYEKVVYRFTPENRNKKIRFEVNSSQKEDVQLKEIKSENNDSARLVNAFLIAFRGNSLNADECSIINPQVLRIQYISAYNGWAVTSAEPLQIFNESLGYKIICQLDECYMNARREMTFCNAYSWFQESSSKRNEVVSKWIYNRNMAYQASLLHFMQAFYAGRLEQEGFLVSSVTRIYEKDDRDAYAKALKEKGNILGWNTDSTGVNTLSYVDVISSSILSQDKIRKIDTAGMQVLLSSHQPRLQVRFRYDLRIYTSTLSEWTPISYIQIRDHKDITVESDGMYFDPADINVTGYWALLKISDQLPNDFVLVDNRVLHHIP